MGEERGEILMGKSSAGKPRLGHVVTPGLNNTIIKSSLIFHPSTQQTLLNTSQSLWTQDDPSRACPKTPEHLPEGGWECRERAANPGGDYFKAGGLSQQEASGKHDGKSETFAESMLNISQDLLGEYGPSLFGCL